MRACRCVCECTRYECACVHETQSATWRLFDTEILGFVWLCFPLSRWPISTFRNITCNTEELASFLSAVLKSFLHATRAFISLKLNETKINTSRSRPNSVSRPVYHRSKYRETPSFSGDGQPFKGLETAFYQLELILTLSAMENNVQPKFWERCPSEKTIEGGTLETLAVIRLSRRLVQILMNF